MSKPSNMSSLKRGMKEFYLTVHPDFFHNFPEEQKINEQSLKLLHSNVQSIENGLSVAELSLTFFKKRPGSGCYPVRLRLLPKTTTTSLYQEVLKAFDFPFEKNEKVCQKHNNNDNDSLFNQHDNLEKMDLGNFQKEVTQLTLVEWLQENVNIAREAQLLSEPYLNKIAETTKIMQQKFGIRQLYHNYKLSYTSLNNLMTIFLDLLINKKVSNLKDRSLILGNFTGLDQNGRFVIDPFSPQETWKKALEELPDSLVCLKDLDNTREQLSKECFGIRFLNSRSINSMPVYFYHKALVTTLNALLQDKKKYQHETLSSLMALIEWDGAFLRISKEGFLLIPHLTSKKSLLDYALRNKHLIQEQRIQYLKDMKLEHKAMSNTKSSLSLKSFFKDPALTAIETISACNKILNMADVLDLQGCDVITSKYFDVSSDGVIRIPWNFLE